MRETLKAQVERLTIENANLRNKLDEAYAEAIRLNSQLSRKHSISDTPAYQSLLRDKEQWQQVANSRKEQIEKSDKRHAELISMYEELQKQLNASVTAYNALKSDWKITQRQLQETQQKLSECIVEPHNARRAGRKPQFTAEQIEEVKLMHQEGMSIRKIAEYFGCSAAVVHKTVHK